jgi:molecular chaperone GrpE
MSHKHHHESKKIADPPEVIMPEEQKAPSREKIPVDDSEKLRAELEQAKDRSLRLQAELDNYRKRASRELEDRLKYADMGILRELLPVLDNIQRAVEHAENSSDPASLLEGFKMVGNQLQSVLEERDCTKIPAFGAPFDPNLHHAISQMPSADHPANTILIVTQDGYQLHDRVVRPSQVVVSVPPPKSDENIQEKSE